MVDRIGYDAGFLDMLSSRFNGWVFQGDGAGMERARWVVWFVELESGCDPVGSPACNLPLIGHWVKYRSVYTRVDIMLRLGTGSLKSADTKYMILTVSCLYDATDSNCKGIEIPSGFDIHCLSSLDAFKPISRARP